MLALVGRLLDALAEPWVEAEPVCAAETTPNWRQAWWRGLQAAMVSGGVHAVALALLAQFMLPGMQQVVPVLHFATVEREPPPPPPELNYVLAAPSEESRPTLLSALALSTAPDVANDAEIVSVMRPTEPIAEVRVVEPLDNLQGFELDERIMRAGTVGEEVVHVEGAVDRLTYEIMVRLEEGRVLVVWLMDASLSLRAERAEVAQRLEKVYRELEELGGTRGDDLHSAVVSFGQQYQQLVRPTGDHASVVQAIRSVADDESGIENVFSAVTACVEAFKHQRVTERRQLMFIIWTDESGDDYARLEEAVDACRRGSIPVFVVGPSAMFSKELGTMPYDHVDGKTYWLPVCRGPDSIRQELIEVPYWFEGPQYDSLHSGLGPFALTRLAAATGGAYFIKDHARDRVPFSLQTMRRYQPEYDSIPDYIHKVQKSPLRRAVLQAVELTRQRKLRGTPRLEFAPTGETYARELQEAQQTAAYNLFTLQQALEAFGPKGLEAHREREPSPRWRAWYDLTYGRLLAMNVRCNEYNWACAEMKGRGADFVDKKSNRWKFVPDPTVHCGSQYVKQANEAIRLLTRCVQENPGTPWALLAQRELEHPLGFVVQEAYVAPPPPPKQRPGNNAPPPRPNNEVRTEQPRMLPKPPPLPKL